MKTCCITILLAGCIVILTCSLIKPSRFPYKKAGLTERQAAEHLLDRFTYGATPAEVDAVVKMGLENWFQQQLQADLPDDSLDRRLSIYSALHLSNTEVCHIYLPGFAIRSMAIKDSVISKDSVDRAVDKKAFNEQVQAYMDMKGFKSDQDLYKQFINQNILRATYSNNQLQEVLTDFWFNHFNVSFFKGECAQFIPAYERDVIRPNALGSFDKLLMASAKSPAMLYYLDNFTSVGPTPPPPPKKPATPPPGDSSMNMMMMGEASPATTKPVQTLTKPQPGLNENYAREVMELHTLGVDGGYTQQDVTQAARVLTGWTVYPISEVAYGSNMKGLVEKVGVNNLAAKGYVRDSDFLFTPNRHDHGEKTVLGHVFPANKDAASGYQEGVDLLEMLAHHPSTAQFICRKLAVRFVSDNPPQSLIDKMANTFLKSEGDIRQVLTTMVTAPEFWNKQAVSSKTKSPFQLAISAVRGLNADITDPYPLYNWITRMGEKRYYYQAPTGFPDRSNYWINTGSLLNRMDFSLALTTGQIQGIKVNLNASGVAPKDAQSALAVYSKQLLPNADLERLRTRLIPMINDPALLTSVNAASTKAPVPTQDKPIAGAPGDMMFMGAGNEAAGNKTATAPPPTQEVARATPPPTNNKPLQNPFPLVVGILIGSPEFQLY
ncbi:hypothetical protein F5148DRAFT_1294288 [Russula earlei]|uniref:Uncharacterized protein n=1 Tax=Russula earlei TaxID=71964 RepID=A0ACC0TRM6_9AGAM|nr:hypothetical protein F5148DRAFT_1294288 [Russula earlei]